MLGIPANDDADGSVGRVAELDLVETRLLGGVSVVVGGHAGVGKTHLARAVARRHRSNRGPVEWLSGVTGRSRLPFGAVLRLLPDDAGRGPEDFAARDAQVVRRAVAALGADPDRLLVVDDVHLLDDWSALLVQSLVLDGRVPVMMTCRSGEVAPESVAVLWKDRLAERIDLLPLSPPETVDLATRVLGGPVEPEAASWLVTESGGNPLLLGELISDARASDDLTLHHAEWHWSGRDGGGRRLRDVIAERLRTGDPHDVRALATLGLAEPLTTDLLRRVLPDWDPGRCEARGLATIVPRAGRDEVRLAHPLFGETALDLLDTVERTALPGLIADELAHGPDDAESRIVEARLRLESGDRSHPERFVTAAGDALTLGAAAFALELLDAVADPLLADSALRIQALIHSGDYRAATDALIDRLQRPILSDSERVSSFQGIVHTARMLDESAWIEEAYRLAANAITDPVWRAILDATRLQIEMMAGRTGAATAQAEAILAEHPDNRHLRVRLVSSVGSGRSIAGRNQAAIDFVGTALEDALALQADLPIGIAWAINAQALALLLAGHLPEAADFVELVRSVTPSDGSAGPWLDLFAGRVDLARGRAGRAAVQLGRAADGFGDDDLGGFHRWARSLEAEALALTGRIDDARVAAARAEASTSRVALYESDARRARAWVIAIGGELTRAGDEFVSIAREVEVEGQFGNAIHSLHDAMRLGAGEVRTDLARLLDHVDGRWSVAFNAELAAMDSGRGIDWASATDALVAVGASLQAAEVATIAARVFESEALPARVAQMTRYRVELVAECGRVATPRLADAPERVGLTGREREIAMLAAAGLTNREIAERLFISVRTAEGHLYRACTKLGIAGRDEIAGVLSRNA